MHVHIVLDKLVGCVEVKFAGPAVIVVQLSVLIQVRLGEEVEPIGAQLANVMGGGAGKVILLGRRGPEVSFASSAVRVGVPCLIVLLDFELGTAELLALPTIHVGMLCLSMLIPCGLGTEGSLAPLTRVTRLVGVLCLGMTGSLDSTDDSNSGGSKVVLEVLDDGAVAVVTAPSF